VAAMPDSLHKKTFMKMPLLQAAFSFFSETTSVIASETKN
jgi:hypothetical protein